MEVPPDLILRIEPAGDGTWIAVAKAPITVVAVEAMGSVRMGGVECRGACRPRKPVRLAPGDRMRIEGGGAKLLTLEWGLVKIVI